MRWLIIATLAAVVFMAVSSAIVSWFLVANERPRVPSGQVADRFVDWILVGEAGDPDHLEDELSGYGHAYALLHPSLRETTSFGAFCDSFVGLVERFGPIASSRYRSRLNRSRSGHSYELFFGPPGANHEDLHGVIFNLVLSRTNEGWRVRSYELILSEGEHR